MATWEPGGNKLVRRVLSSVGEYVYGSSSFAENYLWGNNGNDTLVAQANENCGNGYNYLNGYGGNDWLYAGTDVPTRILGGWGDDRLQGKGGDDSLKGEWGNDTYYGMGGNDYIYDDSGDNRIDGNDGNDTISASNGVEQIWGDAGRDHIDCTNIKSGSVIHGGAGRDVIEAKGVGFEVYGDEDADRIEAENTDVSIWSKQCDVLGGGGDDHMLMVGNNFRVVGNSGADYIDVDNAFASTIQYFTLNESRLGNADTIHNRGWWSDTTIDLTKLGHLRWVNGPGDYGVGTCVLDNDGDSATFYAYLSEGTFALNFDYGNQRRSLFLLG